MKAAVITKVQCHAALVMWLTPGRNGKRHIQINANAMVGMIIRVSDSAAETLISRRASRRKYRPVLQGSIMISVVLRFRE